MAMDPPGRFLYSSDRRGGKIWTHSVNEDGSLMPLAAVSRPRTIAVHPSGRALYVVLVSWNLLAYYAIN